MGKSVEISCPPHTSLEEVDDSVVSSEHDELVRGSGPPLVYSADTTAGYVWRAPTRLLLKIPGVLTGLDPTRGSSQGGCKCRGSGRVGSVCLCLTGRIRSGGRFYNNAGLVGPGQEVSRSRGSGRVGSRGFKISRVESGQEVLAGRVGS